MAVDCFAERQGKSDAWGRLLITEIIEGVRPHEFVRKRRRAVDEILALEQMPKTSEVQELAKMLKATAEQETQP